MAIKGLIGQEGSTLGTEENPWSVIYTNEVRFTNGVGTELSEEHLTGFLFDGKPVFEKIITNVRASNSTGTTQSLTTIDVPSNCTIINFDAIIRSSQSILKVPYYYTSSNYFRIGINTEKELLQVYETHSLTDHNNRQVLLKIQYTYPN